MATTVNARDVILQAYSPRVATVSMSPNLVVSQSQVTGLGIVVAGTKMVFLSATSQVFQIAKSGTVSPASTVLTASLKNLTATPTLSVISGTITPTPALVGGTVTIPYANMTTDTALIRLTVVQDGTTYTDEITLVKVREGIDGLMGFVTNEAHTVAADYLGNVLAYTNAGGSFKVFQGVNDITSLCSFSIPTGGNADALTATINATTGVYAVTGGYPTNKDLVTLLLRATFGSVTLDKVFTLSKSKAGAPGTNGTNGTSGTNGVRGSRTFYVTLTGTTAVFSDTLATTTASVEGGPVLNDVVTQYNTSQGFSQTKFYTDTGWVIVNAVVDGNLLVSGTVGATAMQTNLLNADNVLTRGLTVRDTSGNIILSATSNLDYTKVGGTKPPSDATSGAPAGTLINGVEAATVASNAADGAAALSAVNNVTTGLATKLGASVSNILSGAGAIKAGSLVIDTTGSRVSGYGVAFTQKGIAAYNSAGDPTFSIDGATGAAVFKGDISGASGTFTGSITGASGTFGGNVHGGQFTTGAFTGYGWPAAGNYGTYLGPSGLLIGNANNGKYLQLTNDGNIYTPGFDVVNGVMTVKAANVINTVNIAGESVTVPRFASGANTIALTGSWQTLLTSATIDVGAANVILIASALTFIGSYTQGEPPQTYTDTVTFRLLRNGAQIQTWQALGGTESLTVQDTPGSAAYYELQAYMTGNSPSGSGVSTRTMLVLGVKR